MGKKRSRIYVPPAMERALDTALDKALDVQRPVVIAYLERIRAKNPDARPAEVVRMVERRYLAAVVGVGAASGGAAAVPGVGTATAVATGVAEITAFVSATAMFVLAVAEIHGVPVHDPDVRRALVMAVLVGEGATLALEGAAAQERHWAQVIARSASKDNVSLINSRLTRLLATRFGARQGALFIGRALPLGIGAGIGAAGNAALARTAIASARKAFGPAPKVFPGRVVEGRIVDGSADGSPGRSVGDRVAEGRVVDD